MFQCAAHAVSSGMGRLLSSSSAAAGFGPYGPFRPSTEQVGSFQRSFGRPVDLTALGGQRLAVRSGCILST